MASLPQAPAPRERLNDLVEELYGVPPVLPPPPPASVSTTDVRWQQAVTQVNAQLCAQLGIKALPERQRKALEFVRAYAVTLHTAFR